MNPEQQRYQEPGDLDTRYPDLARAREISVRLFRDTSALVTLGYRARQIEYVSPVLELLSQEGAVEMLRRNPYLKFENPTDRRAESAYIYRLENQQGHSLWAYREEEFRGWETLTPEERLMKAMMTAPGVTVFEDDPMNIAHLVLFTNTERMEDIPYLVSHLCEGYRHTHGQLKPETTITKIGRKLGLFGTYTAAWADERTMLDLVIRLNTPVWSPSMIYRRLPPQDDDVGRVIPFGEKANVSASVVHDMFAGATHSPMSRQLIPRTR